MNMNNLRPVISNIRRRPSYLVAGVMMALSLAMFVTVPASAMADMTATRLVAQAPAPSPTPNPNTTTQQCPQGQCIIDNYINPAIRALAAVVGVAVVLSIIVGGIQYTTSGDDPQKVSAAKQRIFKSLIALLAFFFLFRFLTWLIPGTPQ